jgi:hypothetical protein
MKAISKEILKTIEIETLPDGFVIWIKEGNKRHWLLDGSMLKKDGEIFLGSSLCSIKWNYKAHYNKKTNSIELIKN